MVRMAIFHFFRKNRLFCTVDQNVGQNFHFFHRAITYSVTLLKRIDGLAFGDIYSIFRQYWSNLLHTKTIFVNCIQNSKFRFFCTFYFENSKIYIFMTVMILLLDGNNYRKFFVTAVYPDDAFTTC